MTALLASAGVTFMVAALLVVVALFQQAPAKGPHAAPAPTKSATPAPAPEPEYQDGAGALDEPRKVAEAYLHALAGDGSDAAKSYLLGGATMTAQELKIPSWKIVQRQLPRIEEAKIKDAVAAYKAVDDAAAKSLRGLGENLGENDSMQLSQAQAEKALAPTQAVAGKLQTKFPVFAYVARVGKDIFWHPENPWRKEVEKLGDDGSYRLELHLFKIEEKDGAHTRVWPLRVLRVKSAKYDSGWKILPASDWNPEY